jgi:nitroreductase/dihydropteridine reductase
MNVTEYMKQLNWRYATKQFDSSKKLSAEQVQFVKEVLRLSPSSSGMQPWKFVIVTNPELRQKLREKAYGQAQITDSALIVVLCILKAVNEDHVNKVLENTAAARHQTPESLQEYRDLMLGLLKSKNPEQLKEWASDQVYIALGMLLSACAALQIDACPMEGFDRAGFDELLELEKEGCASYVVCAIGFRSAEDKFSQLAKARLSEREVIVER